MPRTTLRSPWKPTLPTPQLTSRWINPTTGFPWLTSIGPASLRGCHPSWPWSWSVSPSPPAVTARAVDNASHVPGTHNFSTPSLPPHNMSAPLPGRSLAPTPCPNSLLNSPSSRTLSSRSPVSLLPPPLAACQDVLLPTSVPQLSCSTPPVLPASSPSVTTPSRRSPTSTRVHRHLSTAAAPAKPGSLPSSVKDFSPTVQPSFSRPTRIIPAHSHEDYNRRDYSRSAVPGSVSSLKCFF